jgi:Fe-S oxidoreductase
MGRNGGDALRSAELDAALSNCLSCKGCTPECPSNVNLALLKAELMFARHRRDGLPLRERILSEVDLLGRIGCALPGLANALLGFGPLRALMERTLGLSAKRSLPRYARERFDRWFARRSVAAVYDRRNQATTAVIDRRYRGQVILWDDTFVRYHEPHIGVAAVKVLEALGFEVMLPVGRSCCGRPAFSQGNLDYAASLGKHNVALLSSLQHSTAPVLFLEPSCYSMFAEDYRELKIAGAPELSPRCFLFETFVEDFLAAKPDALRFRDDHSSGEPANVAIHAHCHAKSLLEPAFMKRLVERLPGRKATLLDTGCCGMAGAFGMFAAKYQLSLRVAEPLVQKINAQPPRTEIVASGTSCRHQIADLSAARPKHMAELIADAIA